MKKVVTIHLSGKLFQIEDDAYRKLDGVLMQLKAKDPVKYDFALTRLGIRGGGQLAPFLAQFGAREVI